MAGDQGARSVSIGRDASGNVFVTGDHNRVKQTTLPPAEQVDVMAELEALRAELAALQTADAGKIGRALDDAEDDAAKEAPDKAGVAGAVDRALSLAQKAEDFSAKTEKLVPRIRALAGWLGEHGPKLLGYVGLAL